jgi:ABC-type branched-subunit amino acid transport system substrate-binding protein
MGIILLPVKRIGTIWIIALVISLLSSSTTITAQESKKVYKVGLFLPLHLDAAFDTEGNYRYAPKTFPKIHTPALEFYEGALLALDTLLAENSPIELIVKDTRSTQQTLLQQLNSPDLQNIDLLLAYCSANEIKTLAEIGLQKGIPVINVNLPNDGGVKDNPYLVLLSSTLNTQATAIYNYISEKYAKQNIVVFRKKGALEDRIKNYWEEAGKAKGKLALKLTYVDLPDSFTVNQLIPKLDTLKSTLCVAGSLDENFGKQLASQLATLAKKNYKSTLIGMPTWDGIRDFAKPEYRGIDIIYCTPYYNPRTDSISQYIVNLFNENIYARPSDMVMRGYEAVWHFSKLLHKYGADVSSNLSSREFEVFRELNIKPHFSKGQMSLDYFENKKLYFLKWQDGQLKHQP